MSDALLIPDAAVLRARRCWRYTGDERPPFAIEPGPGQESVWDYPRPPRIVPDPRHVEVRWGDRLIAESARAVRVLETASPPTFYLPPEDVHVSDLVPSGRRSICEWKGIAIDLDLAGGSGGSSRAPSMASVAWSYPKTFPEFASIRGWISFYPAKLECRVDGERVRPQPGSVYGGWITDEIVGPVKGEPGCDGL
jgi:uncharacterized protein (DUF427 family)